MKMGEKYLPFFVPNVKKKVVSGVKQLRTFAISPTGRSIQTYGKSVGSEFAFGRRGGGIRTTKRSKPKNGSITIEQGGQRFVISRVTKKVKRKVVKRGSGAYNDFFRGL